jgi:hypothetical protein
MTEEYRDYKEDLQINIHALPAEWERQPQLFIYWAEEHAYAMQKRDKAKERVDLLRAQLDSDLRINFTEYGFTAKPTEAAISAAILQQPDYMTALEELSDANVNLNLMLAAKNGMETKRKALENLTQLQIAGFYGANTAPAQAKVAAAKTAQDKQKEHLAEGAGKRELV